jgi:hypothetical protein
MPVTKRDFPLVISTSDFPMGFSLPKYLSAVDSVRTIEPEFSSAVAGSPAMKCRSKMGIIDSSA